MSEITVMKIVAAGDTDTGKKRTNNEDSLLIDERAGLYAVADGIGGHSGGEVASSMAVETLLEIMKGHAAAPAASQSSSRKSVRQPLCYPGSARRTAGSLRGERRTPGSAAWAPP